VRVVSVINYKGGVGKTTLTANIGAALAFMGRRVLLIDLDPQTSLTFSFYRPEEWEHRLAPSRTIKRWYDTTDEHAPTRLADLVSTPQRVNERVKEHGGRLDLIASHLDLINIDLELAAELGGGTWSKSQANYLKTHRRLADGLSSEDFEEYDVALIDCAPNFNITTKTAIVASTHLLVPARPDYLSTLGLTYLVKKTGDLVGDYNACVESRAGQKLRVEPIGEPAHRVVYTMVQQYAGEPIQALRPYMEQIRDLGVPAFGQTLRDNKTLFAGAGEDGIPAVLSDTGNPEIVEELDLIAAEFAHWIESE
jgi:chromosome partitioning protein